ncbi:Box C/D snoRNA protein 1 [Halocaridina rubra]|uniref:Box C/D snoRNA protein 1 n=1 Tax=Halocaridina rubra TaxID=373956 RepID=A0AAN8XJA8_HALRR
MESDNHTSEALKSRLGTCSVCIANLAKYTCPSCKIKTCSLSCVKTHKDDTSCSGVRSKTAMIHKEDMDNLTLLSDYRFLEEIDHKLEDTGRDPLRRYVAPSPYGVPSLPPFLIRLKTAAWKRGTHLRFMPKHFVAHKENSTRYIFQEGIIRWHVKWVFHQADISFTEESVNENKTIIDLLAKYLEPDSSVLSPEEAEKLAYYHSASYKKIAVLLKNADRGSPVFEEMFVDKSLLLNLANKTVKEFPVFYVVLRDHIHFYMDLEADDDHNFNDLFDDHLQKTESDKDESLCYF